MKINYVIKKGFTFLSDFNDKINYDLVLFFYSKKGNFSIVPILVGSLTPENENKYGRLLSKYLMDPENVFVVSSDFCHWG